MLFLFQHEAMTVQHPIEVLDLFSAAAGGWSLGMHRAGFKTLAACEFVDWRRALYQENNPGVRIYDDVRTLTADQLVRDFGRLPSVVVGSPPCQDISSANTKGKGVEGARSGLYFEAIRLIREIRDLGRERGEGAARWFALENSANLRTRGADAVLAALEAIGYSCWTFVVRAGDIGANHERPRCWIIGCDIEQVTDADGFGWYDERSGRRGGFDLSVSDDISDPEKDGCGSRLQGRRASPASGAEQSSCRDARNADQVFKAEISGFPRWSPSFTGGSADANSAGLGHEGGRARGHRAHGNDAASIAESFHADASKERPQGFIGRDEQRKGEIAKRANLLARPEMGLCEADSVDLAGWESDWSLDDLAAHLQLDDGFSTWLAGTRIAVGGARGTSAASLIVEAFGDAVVPQIPEAIGRAILRTERALAVACGRIAA